MLESWETPLPESLLHEFCELPAVVYRVAGHWTLNDDGRELQLEDLQMDGVSAHPRVRLTVEAAPRNGCSIAGQVYTLSNHPGVSEFLPDEIYWGKLQDVLRADTLVIQHAGKPETIRLAGIVCPELEAPFGQEAADQVRALVDGRPVLVKIFDDPPSQPRRAHLFTSDFHWLSLKLIELGLAWHDKPTDHEWLLSSREDEARKRQLGLWSQDHPQPPW